ncbi:MAG: hypothetical protein AAGE84_03480 [Cyanobacteria bacterium P01_G01_bin.39]
MLLQKLLATSTVIILCIGYSQAASACEDKYSYSAYGRLERSDLDRLKQEYRNQSMQISRQAGNKLYLEDVKRILGFSGQQTKTASNGRIEQWIWLDYDKCSRKIKASFRDGELMKVNSYGF